MVVLEVSEAKYKELVPTSPIIFNSPVFSSLNSGKVDSLHFLIFQDSRVRMGLIGGVDKGIFKSPFSAPFGGFTIVRENISILQIEETIMQFMEWCTSNSICEIRLVLPPSIYDENNLAKLINVLYRVGFKQENLDLNYSFLLKNMNDFYESTIPKNARKNLKNARLNDLEFSLCNTDKEREVAYNIIEKNREERGFPLRMTWEQVRNTITAVTADFFLIMIKEKAIASAVVFHVTTDIVQVIYWGDVTDFSNLRPMNFLSYEIFNYYKKLGMRMVDIGPSTENSLPNHGLCDFKESIGCDVNLKTTWSYRWE